MCDKVMNGALREVTRGATSRALHSSARAMRRALERCVARASTSVVTSRSFSLAVSSSAVAAATVEGREDEARARARGARRGRRRRETARARAIAREGGARGWRQWISSSASDEGTSGDGGRTMEVAIDRSGLRRALERGARANAAGGDDAGEEAVTREGMLGHLERAIKFAGGSIPVSDYVRECLTHPEYGYYMRGDVFGKKGDFVTSPEISQVFGEMLGVWAALQYEALGSPDTLRVIEFGPGRGTLMADLLRGTSKFAKFREAMSVHLIEVSPALREMQAKTLKCTNLEKGAPRGVRGLVVPKNILQDEHEGKTVKQNDGPSGEAHTRGKSEINGANVYWHDGLESVPNGPTLVICHEFFDALPVRQFQRTERGWCEKLITIDSGLVGEGENPIEKVPGRDLEMVLSPGPTPASHMLVSRRLKGLPKEQVDSLRLLELSPPSMTLWDNLIDRIEKHSGAAIAIDYGEEGPLGNTLEAIKDHKFVHVLDTPGEADLSAYVDFGSLRQIVEEKPQTGVKCFGPVTQQQLLLSLGLIPRLEKLVDNASSEAQADGLVKGCERLVGESAGDAAKGEPPGMGIRYKALCMVSRGLAKPVGF